MMNITPEMISFFYGRTDRHIQLVIKNAARLVLHNERKYQGLMLQTQDHDQSKYASKERLPYIVLTWEKYCENNIPFNVDEAMKKRIKTAIFHHIKHNRHHPECHDSKFRTHSEVVNGTKMLDLDLHEMVCDWMAMGQELQTDTEEYANKVIGSKFIFSDKQVELIHKDISILKNMTEEI